MVQPQQQYVYRLKTREEFKQDPNITFNSGAQDGYSHKTEPGWLRAEFVEDSLLAHYSPSDDLIITQKEIGSSGGPRFVEKTFEYYDDTSNEDYSLENTVVRVYPWMVTIFDENEEIPYSDEIEDKEESKEKTPREEEIKEPRSPEINELKDEFTNLIDELTGLFNIFK